MTNPNAEYSVKVFSPTIYVEIIRQSNNQLLFSTARGPLIVSDKYFEWSIFLNVDYLIGLGQQFLLEGQTYLLFNNEVNSTVPFIMGYSEYHLLKFLINSSGNSSP